MPENPDPGGSPAEQAVGTRTVRLGVDGWANLLVGIAVVLAIAGVLPKIPW
jgi:hypothetical protein